MINILINVKILFILLISFQRASCQLYVGCYDNLSGFSPSATPVNSASDCLAQCRGQSTYFAAVKEGTSCYCVNETIAKVPSANCNITCAENGGSCGGDNFYSLYSAIPTYHGCFADNNEHRDLSGFSSDTSTLTIDICYGTCFDRSYKYMGVQFSGQCFCGQAFGMHDRISESECAMKCTGDPLETCGGERRNNIYGVDHFLGLNKNYSEVFHCVEGNGKFNYSCVDNKCQHGWREAMCNMRDCKINNGECGEHKCEENRIGDQIISECVCNKGFQSNSIYHECTDIDECQTNPCNGPSETCVNTIGSFMCLCSPGYNYANQSECGDRCNENLYLCENADTCNKVPGYKCDLKGEEKVTNPPGCLNASGCDEHLDFMSMYKEESNAGKIVGAVLGTILSLIVASSVAVLLYFLFIKRKNRVDDEKNVTSSDIVEENNNNNNNNKIIVPEVKEYFLNHKNDIVTQFNECRLDFGYSQAVACMLENTNKNRSGDVLPYDYNRVVLNYEHDYINASFIQTYGNISNVCFIASQGPKHETAEDFWRMTWDNKVKIVVMLDKCHEHGKEMCHQYWPNEGSMEIGDFVIQSHEKEETLNLIKTTFKVIRNDEERQMIHFSYISWMDNAAPENIFSLLNLREKVLSLIDQESENKIVVHCSDGVGRTGTFIALDYLIRQAEQEGCVDFCECLNFLRNQRCNMIQSLSQYELCFRAMAMFHKLGKSTFISTEDSNVFKHKMEELTDEMIQKQFDVIDEEVSVKKAVTTANVIINCSSNPIEAVLAPSSQKSSSYAIGVMPSAFVVEDLFEIFDGPCSMFILLDNENLTFLPNDDQQILLKNGSIQLTETKDCDFYKKYSFKIDKHCGVTDENTEFSDHSDTNLLPNAFLVHVSKDVSTSFDDLIQLYSVVKPVLGLTDKPAVTVISRSGYKDAGFLVAVFNIMQMIDISKEVDVYETVFELRNVQPEIMNDINLFKNLYSLANHITNKTGETLNTEFLPVKENQPDINE